MHGSILLSVHGNRKARWDGQLRTATSTFTQLLNSACLSVRRELVYIHAYRLAGTQAGRQVGKGDGWRGIQRVSGIGGRRSGSAGR